MTRVSSGVASGDNVAAMKIAIVGTGAMGSVYAARLASAGNEVWAIDTWQAHLDAIARDGLSLVGPGDELLVKSLRVGRTPGDAGPCDVWVVATKAADVDAAVAGIVPLLAPDSVVMAFQNGLGAGERVAQQVPREQVLVGIAEGFGSSIPAPGHVHHNGMRLIRIGELDGGLTHRVQHIEGVWRDAGFNVQAFDDIDRMVWEKLLCNVTLSAPTAVFDVTVGELMANADAWAVALGCAMECYRLGQAKGIAWAFDDPVGYVTEFSATIPHASPSMRLDHLARRRSEVDVINGAVVSESRALGLDAPYNETLCAVLRERESRFP